MIGPWTNRQREILKEMREAGKDWDEISEALGRTEYSCRSRAELDGVRKCGGKPFERHIGITDDGPALNYRNNGRPMAKPMVERPCISCKKMFKSWDRTKNQRCARCNSLSDTNTVYM